MFFVSAPSVNRNFITFECEWLNKYIGEDLGRVLNVKWQKKRIWNSCITEKKFLAIKGKIRSFHSSRVLLSYPIMGVEV